MAAIVAAASQWYIYDAIHGDAELFSYYLVTCAYLCGALTPTVLWLGRRRYIDSRTWKRSLPIHIAASLLLTGLGVFIEATLGWLPNTDSWPFSEALRHYFRYHTQISLLSYWILLVAFHGYRLYDQARIRELCAAQLEAQLADAHLSALCTQLQPHFLFNTLQAATMLIYDDPQGAEEVLLSLSELLRISLHALEQQEVALSAEIDFVKHYATIQQRRFGDRLRFHFEIENGLADCAVPSLVLQPLVENAIRHGIGTHKEPDVVTVHASSRDGRLHLEVRNLASVLEDSQERLFTRGVGMANTLARLEQLYGARQSFDIHNLEPRGVAVLLSIPLHSPSATRNELVGELVR